MSASPLRDKIRELNDRFRKTFAGGLVVVTQGVAARPSEVQDRVLARIREFNAFTTDNDPYGEHDFGCVEVASRKYFWKIDYLDRDMKHSSDDPPDPQKTMRVLTIMLAEEY